MLQGLKVVEFATYVAGPSAAVLLADWGADVIKVERAAGDPTRDLFKDNPDFEGCEGNPVFEFENRGKRGLVIDITQPSGRAALMKVLKGADVFITNLRQRTLAKGRLDYASIKDELPDLIYCGITGYGSQGEAADWPAFDIAALWTRAGMAGVVIPEGVDPFPCRPGMGDSICALATTSAVLSAVIERQRTGKGRLVETSLIRSGVYAVGWDLSVQAKFGKTIATRPRDNAISALANYYRTADGHWLSMLARGDQWEAISFALGLDGLQEDERFETPEARKENSRELIALFDEAFARLSLSQAMAMLSARDVIVAPLQAPAEVIEDRLAQEAGCFFETEDALGAQFLTPAGPVIFEGSDAIARRRAPELDEHTREILAEAGYGPGEIDELIASGAAGVLPSVDPG